MFSVDISFVVVDFLFVIVTSVGITIYGSVGIYGSDVVIVIPVVSVV